MKTPTSGIDSYPKLSQAVEANCTMINDPWMILAPGCPRPIQIVSIEECIHQIRAAIEVQNATQLQELRAIDFAAVVLVQAFKDGIEAQQRVVCIALASTGRAWKRNGLVSRIISYDH